MTALSVAIASNFRPGRPGPEGAASRVANAAEHSGQAGPRKGKKDSVVQCPEAHGFTPFIVIISVEKSCGGHIPRRFLERGVRILLISGGPSVPIAAHATIGRGRRPNSSSSRPFHFAPVVRHLARLVSPVHTTTRDGQEAGALLVVDIRVVLLCRWRCQQCTSSSRAPA